VAAAAALIVGLTSFLASPLHLGRPIYAYRAMKMWKRSWLSREVVLLTSFGFAATVYAALLWRGDLGAAPVGALTTLLGLAGITASAFIYRVPARPAWDSRYTVAEFLFTAAILGPLFVMLLGVSAKWLALACCAAASLQLLNQTLKLLWLASSEEFELKAASRLLFHDLRKRTLLRFGLLIAGGIVAPLLSLPVAAFVLALGGELLGRYLFFVSVVPKNMAMSFFGGQKEAA
jgi:DMSO reductase anchor subunit